MVRLYNYLQFSALDSTPTMPYDLILPPVLSYLAGFQWQCRTSVCILTHTCQWSPKSMG